MNTLFALLVISSIGGVEETYRFDSQEDCQHARDLIEQKTMCVSVKVRNPSADITEFFNSFTAMTKDFRNKEKPLSEEDTFGPTKEYQRQENGISF